MTIQITSSCKTFHIQRADTMTEWSPEVSCSPIRLPVILYVKNEKFFEFWEVVEIPLHFQHTTFYSSTGPSQMKPNQVSSVHCIPRLPFPKVNRDDGVNQGSGQPIFHHLVYLLSSWLSTPTFGRDYKNESTNHWNLKATDIFFLSPSKFSVYLRLIMTFSLPFSQS